MGNLRIKCTSSVASWGMGECFVFGDGQRWLNCRLIGDCELTILGIHSFMHVIKYLGFGNLFLKLEFERERYSACLRVRRWIGLVYRKRSGRIRTVQERRELRCLRLAWGCAKPTSSANAARLGFLVFFRWCIYWIGIQQLIYGTYQSDVSNW